MRKLTTDEIAVAVAGTVTGKNTEITSICTDTRKITEGCLFFALVGENFDGHDFAQKAAELGAAAIVCHKRVECDCTVINVFDTRAALLDLAGYYRRLFDIPLVALTGSVGKTTKLTQRHLTELTVFLPRAFSFRLCPKADIFPDQAPWQKRKVTFHIQ